MGRRGLHAISARQVQLVRDAGALAELPLYLSQLGMTRPWMGDFAGAASLIAETDSVAAATGSRIAPYTLLRLRALQGREAEASAAIASAIEQAAAGGQGLAASLRALGGRGPVQRPRPLRGGGVGGPASHLGHRLPVDVHVGAARARRGGRARRRRRARSAMRSSGSRRRRSPAAPTVALGIEARCRALLSDGAAAERLYREAIDRLGRTRLRPELARAHLLYGEWLRREGRRVDAREQLRTAHDMFAAIGMEAFAERARRELIATGEKVRKRSVETRDQLTPQEEQIARLARDGLSNPEIGAQLFLCRAHGRMAPAQGVHQARHQLPPTSCRPRWRSLGRTASRPSRGLSGRRSGRRRCAGSRR